MILYLVSVSLFALFLLRMLITAYASSIRDVPGPVFAKFTDLWRMYYVWRGDFHITMRDWRKKYGDLVRVGPNAVLLSQKGQYEKVFGFKEDFIKSDASKVWQSIINGRVVENVATTQSKAVHMRLKKPIASLYSMTNVLGFEPQVCETTRYFLRRLDESFIGSGKACDIDNWLQYYAFDVITQFTISRRLGFLDEGTDFNGILKDITAEFDYRAVIGSFPTLDNWLAKNPLYLWLKQPTSKLVLRSREVISSRLRDEKHVPGTDFMDRFLEQKKHHPDIVDDQVVAGYVGAHIAAGSDTTAVILRSILYYVLKTPGVLQRVREELDNSGTKYPIPYKIASQLPYLDAVIREAMRIHPIMNWPLERVVHAGGLQLPSGHRLEPGIVVSMNAWTLHFDESIFGKDPENFRPDRWLQHDQESDDAFHHRLGAMKHNDFIFSYGPRVCLGRNIATLEIYTVMPTLLGLLDIEFVEPNKDWRISGALLARQYDMDVRLSWRQGVQKEQYID